MPASNKQSFQIFSRALKKATIETLELRLQPILVDEKPLPPPLSRRSKGYESRLGILEKAGINFKHLIGLAPRPAADSFDGNIESFIGLTQIPTGAIGPLRINGFNAKGDFYVPLATSEGALVSSYARGARLVSLSGGVSCITLTEHVQRAPGFAFLNLAEAARFGMWVSLEFEHFKAVAATKTSHGQLLDLKPHFEGNQVHLIFTFYTGDASGQNMVTFCTEAICMDILERSPIKPHFWFIESNMSGDKKATGLSLLETRGRKVVAECKLPRNVVESGLRTTPERMCDYWRMSFVGGAQTGSIGVSGHVSNGIAALFLACGQDLACVSEASIGITRLETTSKGDLYVSVTMPNLIVGTVGGGTVLPTAQECLKMMDCIGTGKAAKFAEICAAVALCGEISIIGAMCSGDFSSAHQRLGRKGTGDASAD